jgi:glyoxylase-like metal-dependent hydrolase (beta-lactamase superfamily II)
MPPARFEPVTAHVDRFTPDDRTDRPVLGAVHGRDGTLLVESGASVAHLTAFVAALETAGRPPAVAIALTHWHWDHSFGSAALDVPVIAHRDTAAELAVQAGYDWSDAALDERVADGREIAFCADMIRLEIPDRRDLRIVVPDLIFDTRHSIDLGGIEVVIDHVGGDHAADSSVVHVPAECVLFLGDCLYQCLHAPEPFLTAAGVWALLDRLAPFEVKHALEGHDDDVADAAAYAARREELRRAADLVEADPDGALAAAAGDEELSELVEFLLVGARVGA